MEENVTVGTENLVSDAVVLSAEVPQKKKRKPINQQKLQDNLWGWAFCLPLIVGTVLFVYVAFVLALLLSFTNYAMGTGATLWGHIGKLFSGDSSIFNMTQYGGKANDPFYWYRFIFTDEGWSASAWQETHTVLKPIPGTDAMGEVARTMNVAGATLFNTVFYLIGIPIGMVLAMFFAVCMSRDIKGGSVFRVLYYVPCVASSISIIFTFQNLFKVDGVINQLTGSNLNWMIELGQDEYSWAPSIDTYWSQGMLSKMVIVIMSVWKGLGGTIILYVAGLSGVNAATKEAAQIDGANGWMIFWKVTIPDLAPVIFYNIVTSVIGGMQIYAEPELLFDTGGQPNLMVSGYVSLINYYGFRFSELGGRPSQGAAYGMILAIIIFALTLFQFWLDGRKKD